MAGRGRGAHDVEMPCGPRGCVLWRTMTRSVDRGVEFDVSIFEQKTQI